mmetsp:Transcript_15172/g.38595  ORF Transcript_15172/g.38595 Transcript_15172/m.38595 type:complete len:230 (+) Transcript_15172:220-909(+)
MCDSCLACTGSVTALTGDDQSVMYFVWCWRSPNFAVRNSLNFWSASLSFWWAPLVGASNASTLSASSNIFPSVLVTSCLSIGKRKSLRLGIMLVALPARDEVKRGALLGIEVYSFWKSACLSASIIRRLASYANLRSTSDTISLHCFMSACSMTSFVQVRGSLFCQAGAWVRTTGLYGIPCSLASSCALRSSPSLSVSETLSSISRRLFRMSPCVTCSKAVIDLTFTRP